MQTINNKLTSNKQIEDMYNHVKQNYSKKIAIIQSNYVPWIGYFSIIESVETFIVYECVKYTKNDWRNRNIISTPNGNRLWLTIPVKYRSEKQLFIETEVANKKWAINHYETLRHNFSKKIHWEKWKGELKEVYRAAEDFKYLFEINRLFLNWLIGALGIKSEIIYLDSYPRFDDPTDRLISIIKNYNGTEYISGPSANNYLNVEKFIQNEINLQYFDYKKLDIKFNTNLTNEIKVSILQNMVEGTHEFRNNKC